MAVQGAGYTGSEVATTPANPGYIYADLNFYFSASPYFVGQGISGDVTRVFDANSIRQSIRTIVLIMKDHIDHFLVATFEVFCLNQWMLGKDMN